MGTNYYYHTDMCEHCGRGDEPIHIGKSSVGWCFALHVYPEELEDNKTESLDDWIKLWNTKGGVIKDEYDRELTSEEMFDIIIKRSWEREGDNYFGYISMAEFHRVDHSKPGPNGLVRHKIDGQHCIGHGEGTWDLMIGYFS